MPIQRFKLLSGLGFAATGVASVLIMVFGFNTFGGNSAGVVLNNYSVRDGLMNIGRLLMGVSVIGSYPFIFAGMKNGLLALIKREGDAGSELDKKIVRVGLAAITALALVLENAGFVVSFNGALMGSAIVSKFTECRRAFCYMTCSLTSFSRLSLYRSTSSHPLCS